MKTSIWDILTGVILLGILCMIGAFGAILVNPNVGFNILKPPAAQEQVEVVPTIAIPSVTPTSPGLPPTWTPSPIPQDTKAPAGSDSNLRPSSTPLPTNTFVVLPTFTPSKTPRKGLGGGTCQVTYQNPTDNTAIPKDTAFNMRWTIKNTSKDTWRSDSVDVRFITSDHLHIGNDVLDLPYDVAPNGMIDIQIPMRAPTKTGQYVSNWSLSMGSKSICNFYVQIQVKDK